MIHDPDPHFGSDEQMLAWCEREEITPVRDEEGNWDWHAALRTFEERLTDNEQEPES